VNKSIAERILAILTHMPEAVNHTPMGGICGLFNLKSDSPERYWATREDSIIADAWLDKTMAWWPEFSGNPNFPITCSYRPAQKAFFQTTNKWDRTTEYGAARWRLLEFLTKEAELLVKSYE